MSTHRAAKSAAAPSTRERQYKRVLESLLDRGKPLKVAERVAAAVVNKTRARLSREGQGPRLIREGGSRQQFYPGKGAAARRRGRPRGRTSLVCLTHRRRFKTRAGLLSHYRSHRRRAEVRKHR